MKAFGSIRWRLQFWHGLLLTLVLAGFGLTLLELFREDQFRRVDEELYERLEVIIRSVEREGGFRGRPPREQPPPEKRLPPPRPNLRLGPREEGLFDGSGRHTFYYVAWLPEGDVLSRSASAPRELNRPERTALPRGARLRGSMRECFHFPPPGGCFLVGRDISDRLAEMRRFEWLVAGAGALVLALGLTGGWWISTRALRPISDISTAAAKISAGDLSQRIRAANAGSELGGLVRVLNDTFARLQASFSRQAQFTADASHELRTPVTVILTETQGALGRERSAAEYRESLEACQRAAQRMRRLTESLLILARLDSGESDALNEPCELDQIAQDAVEALRLLAEERSVALNLETSGSVPCVGNAGQLGLVVSNLVRNGISYNRPGGSVTVAVAVRAENGTAVLTVSDTGKGIAPEDLPHIFERFYRADKVRSTDSGYGLGLAITKAILDAHEGTISVTSAIGEGSRFEVRLPFSSPE